MAYDIGVQIYTYREFTIEETCRELADTPVSAIELMDTHLPPDADEETVEGALSILEDAGIEIAGYYGGSFDSENLDAARERFAFASDLGADYVACDFPPSLVEEMAEIAADHDLLVGLHNHGPAADYETVEEVREVVGGAPARIGACLDTGHFLRVDQPPSETVPALGERIHAVHVSDYVGPETEKPAGDGNLDIPELLDLLDDHASVTTPLAVEYEADPENPTPAVAQAARRLRDAQE